MAMIPFVCIYGVDGRVGLDSFDGETTKVVKRDFGERAGLALARADGEAVDRISRELQMLVGDRDVENLEGVRGESIKEMGRCEAEDESCLVLVPEVKESG